MSIGYCIMISSAICLISIINIISGLNSTAPVPLLACHENEKNGQKYFDLTKQKEQGLPYQFSCSDGCGFLFEKEKQSCLECCKIERKTPVTESLTTIQTTQFPRTQKKGTTREKLVVKSQPKQKVPEKRSSGKSTNVVPTVIGALSGAFLLMVLIAGIFVKCKNRRKEEIQIDEDQIMMDGVYDREAQQRFRENDLPFSTQETASLKETVV